MRFGIRPGERHTHRQVIGNTEAVIRCLTRGATYYVSVDAYNAGGTIRGTDVARI